MKTLLLYASTHHGNTEQLARAMAEAAGADVGNLLASPVPDPSGYDLIGLASGVYFGTLHQRVLDFADQAPLRPSQRVFLAATCGVGYRDYTAGVKKLLARRNIPCLGSFQCRGYDTYGIFGKLGGIAKGHPNERDLANARAFLRALLETAGDGRRPIQ